jgi:hypothetical protein
MRAATIVHALITAAISNLSPFRSRSLHIRMQTACHQAYRGNIQDEGVKPITLVQDLEPGLQFASMASSCELLPITRLTKRIEHIPQDQRSARNLEQLPGVTFKKVAGVIVRLIHLGSSRESPCMRSSSVFLDPSTSYVLSPTPSEPSPVCFCTKVSSLATLAC